MDQKKKIKVHRFTNNLQGLQKVMVKDFSWNIIAWNALLFEKTLKQFINSRYRELWTYFKHISWHGETCRNKGGFSRYFLPTPMMIEPKFSQVCYFVYKLWYTKCGPLDNCLTKVSNGKKGCTQKEEKEEEIWFEEFAILNKATAISEVLLKVHQPCTRFYFTLF